MVESNKLKVVWGKRAYASFQQAYKTIAEDSLQNADKVKEDILQITKGLPNHPEKYPPDKFKSNNQGDYRAFEKHNFRVTYRYTKKEIKIIRFRHVKQKPINF